MNHPPQNKVPRIFPLLIVACILHGTFVPAANLKVSEMELHKDGVFGFPQKEAKVLRDNADLRLSVWNNELYLYVQAVLWNDNSPTLGETDDGRTIGDTSNLLLDLDADGKATANVDRTYMLNP